MNQSEKVIFKAKLLFLLFLIIALSLFGISMIHSIQTLMQSYPGNAWFSISFYIYILSFLRVYINEILIGVAFLSIIQAFGKNLLKNRIPAIPGN